MYRTVTSLPTRITTRSRSSSRSPRARVREACRLLLEAVEDNVGIGVVVALVLCDRVRVRSSELGSILLQRAVHERAVVANRVAEVHDVLERRPHVGIGFRPQPFAVADGDGERSPILRTEGADEIGRVVDGEVFRIEPTLHALRAQRFSWSASHSVTISFHRFAITEPGNICTPCGAPGSTCSSVGTLH